MEDRFVFHFCSTCNVCKKLAETPESMKFCSGCKLVQYCSHGHQKEDWPNHKALCKAVQSFKKKWAIDHVYKNAYSISPENLREWNSHRINVLEALKSILERPLNVIETQMVLFPPVCGYCHVYKSGQMFACNKCKHAMYCCKEHQSKDEKHHKVCESVHISFQVNMFRFSKPFDILNFIDLPDLSGVKKFPENMESLIKYCSLSPVMGCCMSERLSFTATIIYVISKVFKTSVNQLTLHVVGADSVELLAVNTLLSAYHLLPHVIQFNIVLIGPMVSDEDSAPLMGISDLNICISSVKSLYHDYVVSSKFVTPDVIVAFNCGFCEYGGLADLWRESLPSLLSFDNTVVIITSLTEQQSTADIEQLCRLRPKDKDISVVMRCQLNPFHSLLPHRDWESEGVFYINGFISVIKTEPFGYCFKWRLNFDIEH